MNIKRTLLKAINHKQWISIEYNNRDDQNTKYWIGVKDYKQKENKDTGEVRLILVVDLFNVTKDKIIKDATIYFDKILSAKEVEGTYYTEALNIEDKMNDNVDEVEFTFNEDFNDKILYYFEDCYKLDNSPYISKYSQILGIDDDSLMEKEMFPLTDAQFKKIINRFSPKEEKERKIVDTLAMNVISINTSRGLFVLAYRKLLLDLENKALIPSKDIIINKSFSFKDGEIVNEVSARGFLDESDYYLLDDVCSSKEEICNAIMKNVNPSSVDDSPHILSLGRDYIINIDKEYSGIREAYDKNELSYPLRSFFGQITEKINKRISVPICLATEANLDQLLVIYQALKYPITFVQGPPGTGKTKTITNTLVNCIFNNKTVLVSTNNNVPLDGIVNNLNKIKYKNTMSIPFPILRLGNDENIKETLNSLPKLINSVESISSDEELIKKVKERYSSRKTELKVFLEKYAEKLELEERLITLKDENIKSAFSLRSFEIVDSQVENLEEKLKAYDNINEENELIKNTRTIDSDILMFLYFESANKIKKIKQPKFSKLLEIIYCDDESMKLDEFKHFISNDDNLLLLLEVFPIIFTTNMSAMKFGSPKPHFDLVIMDEAGQCNAATALIPIIRGKNLLLVGDTCQLKPVIVLDPVTNTELKNKYKINDTYDYIDNSILKMFYTNDTVSNIVLLKNHYRCDPKIISFNNQKFYNKKLSIKSTKKDENPLVFIDSKNEKWSKKNTSMFEVNFIISYCLKNKDKNIGIITPFVNQKNLIIENLQKNGLEGSVSCGTIHEFQGDEKDQIILSTTISSNTTDGTYHWLKNNKELFNVATSRAKEKLILLGNEKAIMNFHEKEGDNDTFYDLYRYINENGNIEVPFLTDVGNRALDIKPFSSELEKAFLDNLLQVIECNYSSTITFRKEVPAASIFMPQLSEKESFYFYSCRFDFVLFDKDNDYPILAIELCGPEHQQNEVVIKRDEKKKQICLNHNFTLVLVDNAYARRYGQLKQTLLSKLFKENKSDINIKQKAETNTIIYQNKSLAEKTKEEPIEKIISDKETQPIEINKENISDNKNKELHKKAKALFHIYCDLIQNNEYKKAYSILENNNVQELDYAAKDILSSEFKKGLFKSIRYIGDKNNCKVDYYFMKYLNNK